MKIAPATLALLVTLAAGNALAEPGRGQPPRFSDFDTDGDGQLSAAEMAEMPTRGRLSGEERFARLDTDGDGYVSRDEMHQARERRRIHRPELEELDVDGDGRLSAAELDKLPTRPDVSPEERFARLDADGDGYVSEDELRSGRGHGGPHGHRRQ